MFPHVPLPWAAITMTQVGLATMALVIVVGVPWLILHNRESRQACETNEDLLAQFQEARDAGEMDDAEFHKVRALLQDSGKPRDRVGGDRIDLTGRRPPAPQPAAPEPEGPPADEPPGPHGG